MQTVTMNSAITAPTATTSTSSSNQSGSNDFVKKLFQMLQEVNYKDVVTWTTNGDSFVVLNTNEFTKEILPRHFKHSNFASFVRQLNKYDFHKVKIPNEEKQNYKYGEDAWEFKHPDFRINDRESLENIKRKGPTTKKGQGSSSNGGNNVQYQGGLDRSNGGGSGMAETDYGVVQHQFQQLNEEVRSLRQENKALFQEINILQTKYKAVVDNIIGLKSFDERYSRSMGILVNCLTQAGIKLPLLDFPNPNLIHLQQPITQTQLQLATQPQPATQSQSSNLQAQSQQGRPPAQPHLKAHTQVPVQPGQPGHSHTNSLGQADARYDTGYSPMLPHHQQHPAQPNDDSKLHDTKTAQKRDLAVAVQVAPGASNTTGPGSSAVARSTRDNSTSASPEHPQVTTTNLQNPKFHVLLVEDDNVCIQLCRKFLVKYGCQVTVATDGLNAILTVEHTRYDLVLMDIVMPNLDGATATSVIRSFDTKTPIIAMTGNIEEYDLVTYLENGMSDILAKPFTREDLYNMLSKHLLTPNETSNNGGIPASTRAPIQEPLDITPSEELHSEKRQRLK